MHNCTKIYVQEANMNHGGCGKTIDEVSGIVIMQKSTRGKSVPVHLKCVPVHLSRKVAVGKVYRYTIYV